MKMPIWYVCFILGAAAALVGMTMGIVMGATQDFTLAPAHAHLNLLGWVTMTLYGLYYRGVPTRVGRLAWVQVIVAALGFPTMTGGLAMLLIDHVGNAVAEVPVMVGSTLVIGSMLMFIIVLIRDARATAAARSVPEV